MLTYSAEEAVANGWSFPHLRVLQKTVDYPLAVG